MLASIHLLFSAASLAGSQARIYPFLSTKKITKKITGKGQVSPLQSLTQFFARRFRLFFPTEALQWVK